jgi:hypothetical protein
VYFAFTWAEGRQICFPFCKWHVKEIALAKDAKRIPESCRSRQQLNGIRKEAPLSVANLGKSH